jgi:hypothetical protein
MVTIRPQQMFPPLSTCQYRAVYGLDYRHRILCTLLSVMAAREGASSTSIAQ